MLSCHRGLKSSGLGAVQREAPPEWHFSRIHKRLHTTVSMAGCLIKTVRRIPADLPAEIFISLFIRFFFFYLLWIRQSPIIFKPRPSCLLRMSENCDWWRLMECVLKTILRACVWVWVHNHFFEQRDPRTVNFTITDKSTEKKHKQCVTL